MPRSSTGQLPHDGQFVAGLAVMMSPGPTFDRVYLALKERVTSGHFAPGHHLEPAALGDELNASITPVRDALHRLVGERLVEAPRNDGFRMPAPTEAALRDLYGWNRDLIELALRPRSPASTGAALHAARQADAAAARHPLTAADLFSSLARRSGNPEHEAAIDNLNDRLAAVRAVEAWLFMDYEGELDALLTLLAGNDIAALRRAVAAYHRRRQRSVPELLVAARLARAPR